MQRPKLVQFALTSVRGAAHGCASQHQHRLRPPMAHWSVRSMARSIPGCQKHRAALVQSVRGATSRQATLRSLTLHRKSAHIVGLYLNPPDHAVVLCVDEKTQVPLQRTQPMLPMGLAMSRGLPTITSVMALPPCLPLSTCRSLSAKRAIVTKSSSRLRHVEVNIPPDFDVHLIVATPPTNIPRSKHGWQSGLEPHPLRPQPTPHGSVRWNAGSASLQKAIRMSKNW